MRTRTSGALTALAAAAAVTLAAGCGDSDDPSAAGGDDEAKITAVATKALTTTDAEVKCVEVVTPGFVDRVYSSLAQCRKAEAPDPDDEESAPTGAEVADISVTGDTASATVTVQGGANDKAAGILRFAKDGDAWKVDDLDVSFLRSQLAQGIGNRTYTAADGPLVQPAFRACVLKGLGALDDATFKTVALKGIAKTTPDPLFVEVFSSCQGNGAPDGDPTKLTADGKLPKAPTRIRQQFEAGLIKTAARSSADAKKVTCILLALRRSITDAEIAAQIAKGQTELAKADNPLTSSIRKAGEGC